MINRFTDSKKKAEANSVPCCSLWAEAPKEIVSKMLCRLSKSERCKVKVDGLNVSFARSRISKSSREQNERKIEHI